MNKKKNAFDLESVLCAAVIVDFHSNNWASWGWFCF